MSELDDYRSNLVNFLTELQGSFVQSVAFVLDIDPAFDKAALPFTFHYCSSITIITDNGIYWIYTGMTSSGEDTFWIKQIKTLEGDDIIKPVYSIIKAVVYKNGYNDFPYKVTIELEEQVFILFAAEIYDSANGSFEYKINDEMILVFEDKREAEKFESLIQYA